MAKGHQNLFEIDNARNLTRDELVATFVPTKSFWRLLSTKHHVVLGSRGSGKTAIAKMISHDHLARLGESKTKRIVAEKAFIGIYVPTELEWVSGLRNKPWQTETEKEEFFQWRLNLSTCIALLATLKSCLETYCEDKGRRALQEGHLATEIGRSWSGTHGEFDSLDAVRQFLRRTELQKQIGLARKRTLGQDYVEDRGETLAGVVFATELFVPLRRGIALASEIMGLPEHSSWLLCIDEAEFLEPMHHAILNSHLRAYSQNLYFKVTTMPYCHYTLKTNTSVPLDVGHDFEYVYIDEDPVILAGAKGAEGRVFADMIFRKRASISGQRFRGVTLRNLLGRSRLLEPKMEDWSSESSNMDLLRKHANIQTLERADRLGDSPSKFGDEIGRKILPALIVRDAVAKQKGRGELDIYSGEMMAVRCGDANPRRLIRLFNKLLNESSWHLRTDRHGGIVQISAKQQTRIFKSFSAGTLNPIQSEEKVGPELFQLILDVGNYMRLALHDMPLSSDQISSISVDLRVSPYANLVRRAVALGLFFPNINAKNPDQLPEQEGRFRLAYVLAPYFDILPRKGKSISLLTILPASEGRKKGSKEKLLQGDFAFGDGEGSA